MYPRCQPIFPSATQFVASSNPLYHGPVPVATVKPLSKSKRWRYRPTIQAATPIYSLNLQPTATAILQGNQANNPNNNYANPAASVNSMTAQSSTLYSSSAPQQITTLQLIPNSSAAGGATLQPVTLVTTNSHLSTQPITNIQFSSPYSYQTLAPFPLQLPVNIPVVSQYHAAQANNELFTAINAQALAANAAAAVAANAAKQPIPGIKVASLDSLADEAMKEDKAKTNNSSPSRSLNSSRSSSPHHSLSTVSDSIISTVSSPYKRSFQAASEAESPAMINPTGLAQAKKVKLFTAAVK
jgi:hypothetical protein